MAADLVRQGPQRAPPPTDPALVAAAVAVAIESGVVDAYLGSLGTVLRRRRSQLARKSEVDAAARFEVGDRVRLGSEVRPKRPRRDRHRRGVGAQERPDPARPSRRRYPAGTEISVSPLGVHRFGHPP
jgi:hypothetical protein